MTRAENVSYGISAQTDTDPQLRRALQEHYASIDYDIKSTTGTCDRAEARYRYVLEQGTLHKDDLTVRLPNGKVVGRFSRATGLRRGDSTFDCTFSYDEKIPYDALDQIEATIEPRVAEAIVFHKNPDSRELTSSEWKKVGVANLLVCIPYNGDYAFFFASTNGRIIRPAAVTDDFREVCQSYIQRVKPLLYPSQDEIGS